MSNKFQNDSAPTVTRQDARGSCKTYFSDRNLDCPWLWRSYQIISNVQSSYEFAIPDKD